MMIEKRIEAFRAMLEKQKLDAFMVLIDENRQYLSGYSGEDTQFDESAGALLIGPKELILATDARYDLQAKSEAPLYDIVTYKKGFSKELPSLLKQMDAKRIGFEKTRMTCYLFEKIQEELKENSLNIELIGFETFTESLRIQKDEFEIQMIKKALAIAENVFMEFVHTLRPGMTEKQAAWELEKRLKDAGADTLSFPIIAAFGRNSALPHAVPSDKPLCEGEPLLFDWGVKLDGYCSDISRTVIIGNPDATFQKVFQTVLEAQQKAIEAIRPKLSGKSVDAIAREHIDAMGYKDRFGHGLGHGVGLAVHEGPRLSPLKDDELDIGMVVTVEPGIYLPDWGGVRLENMVAVRESGAEILNSISASTFRISN
jgi:Xaa-Pro aminopeptidase